MLKNSVSLRVIHIMPRPLIVPMMISMAAFSVTVSAAESEEPPIRLYSTELAHPNPNIAFIEQTRKAIEKELAPRRVTYRMVTIRELDRLVENREVDLVIAGAGFYRRHLRDGLRDVGTLVSSLQPDPNHAVGSVILARADRKDLNTFESLKGRKVSANAPLGFQGHLMALTETAKLGYDPDTFFGSVEFVGMDLLPSIALLKKEKSMLPF